MRHALGAILLGALGACTTLSDQAPPEFQEARNAIADAQAKDVDNQMPRALEAAERKYDRAVDLLDESGKLAKAGESDQADAMRRQAVAQAVAARDIARGSVRLAGDVERFDANPGAFMAQAAKAGNADRLAGENAQLKAQNQELQARVDELTRTNSTLANRAPETQIPADFRVAKPVAFFASGSTKLSAEARADIEELASLLKKDDQLSVTLEGYADPRGSAALNQRLAEQRVQAVATEISRLGVDPSRVVQNPVGATADDAGGRSAGALQLDRKVVAKVTVIAH